jgi:hypothetical protein
MVLQQGRTKMRPENDVLRRYGSYLLSLEVLLRAHSILEKQHVYLYRCVDLIHGESHFLPAHN